MPLSPDFLSYFFDLEDPRVSDRNRRHRLDDIFAITTLATICGADNWVEIVEFADARKDWLCDFLELSHGISSHDTLGRVFSLLDAQAQENLSIMKSIALNMLNKDRSSKIGIKVKRKKVGWNNDYLKQIISQ